ncbi:hypothetical protein FHX82_005770 [Amycolatopsis bartoniae]|uniref:DUF4350 domain-containing protein n=1 Tax=Amycolatopsis bartoniae TaxID=941986 RepID=A0A8H9J2S9_9PSEU|nr:hypothetical protein [Amycolatopsis bartoniae]MBB2938692.1 hypothetical protein [Amycolatopsis bartoniae]TVT11522.1 hypothetical protein FNH07_01485 [Amycolatopsis bartoniae]GHF79461.1 hypothetical protein GCM10017566_62050 [Amycolatopsis bartoniae]
MTRRRWEWVRWGCLAAAVVFVVVFLVAQKQSVSVSYGQAPKAEDPIPEGSAGELSGATVPSTDEMTALVHANAVVRLPGSVASWDEQRVRDAIGEADLRILVAPPGLDEAARDRVKAVDDADLVVLGTQVTGGGSQAVPSTFAEWQAQFATGDVTDLLLTLIAKKYNRPSPDGVEAVRWRPPSAAELAQVTGALRGSGKYLAPGTTVTDIPAGAAQAAFPSPALYVVLPPQPFGQPLPQYGPALTVLFPGRPIVVVYGSWIEYDGPQAADFADVAAAGFYGQFGDRLSTYAYPQRNVLAAYLNNVAAVRYAGLFDRPLPYVPFDALRVALPVLPWLFAACAAVFLVLSARSARTKAPRLADAATHVRLAGLTALAIEVSGLTGAATDAALTRAITALQAARDAVRDRLPDDQVRTLLADASGELDQVAAGLGRTDYRPENYLRGRLA